MSSFEYVLALVSILVGLAVADVAISVHRLLRARARIRWHWLPLATVLLVLLLILNFWWAFYGMSQVDVWTRYWAFLVLAAQLFSLFLLAAAALPDDVPDSGLELAAYYAANQRYFWILFAVAVALGTVVSILAIAGRPGADGLAPLAVSNLILIALLFSLAFVRSRTYHTILVPLLLLLFVWQWWGLRLQ